MIEYRPAAENAIGHETSYFPLPFFVIDIVPIVAAAPVAVSMPTALSLTFDAVGVRDIESIVAFTLICFFTTPVYVPSIVTL